MRGCGAPAKKRDRHREPEMQVVGARSAIGAPGSKMIILRWRRDVAGVEDKVGDGKT